MTGFKAYVVGGAVRDALLGLPVKDRDYVVVGATPEQMQALGFVAVGKDFPVFLHPQTHEEYALARTERKTAPGYAGFAFHATAEVTLEQDLQRRDLTINAIAQDDDGTLIDPYGGRADIDARVFRHVSAAFSEDPVRILRVARFAARFTEFSVAPETMGLMRQMVSSGEVDALVAERVWQELSRGLAEATPSRMFDVLRECGALARILPELDALVGVALRTPMQPMQPMPTSEGPGLGAQMAAAFSGNYGGRGGRRSEQGEKAQRPKLGPCLFGGGGKRGPPAPPKAARSSAYSSAPSRPAPPADLQAASGSLFQGMLRNQQPPTPVPPAPPTTPSSE